MSLALGYYHVCLSIFILVYGSLPFSIVRASLLNYESGWSILYFYMYFVGDYFIH